MNTCDAEGNAFVRELKWPCDEALSRHQDQHEHLHHQLNLADGILT